MKLAQKRRVTNARDNLAGSRESYFSAVIANKDFASAKLLGLVLTLSLVISGSVVQAQQIRTALPFTRVNNSFYERIGIDFGFHLRGTPTNQGRIGDNAKGVFGLGPGGQLMPNLVFSQGGVNSAIPPFGDYDPSADATFGYNVRNSDGGYHLGFRMGKGSNRSIVNTTPVLMTRNGVNGSLFNGTANPFVTGIVPVVGGGGYRLPDFGKVTYTHPLEMKLRQLHMDRQSGYSSSLSSNQNLADNKDDQSKSEKDSFAANSSSTANLGDLSVKEIKRLRQQQLKKSDEAQNAKVQELVRKADRAVANDQRGAARSYLRTAIRYATGNRKAELELRLQQLID